MRYQSLKTELMSLLVKLRDEIPKTERIKLSDRAIEILEELLP